MSDHVSIAGRRYWTDTIATGGGLMVQHVGPPGRLVRGKHRRGGRKVRRLAPFWWIGFVAVTAVGVVAYLTFTVVTPVSDVPPPLPLPLPPGSEAPYDAGSGPGTSVTPETDVRMERTIPPAPTMMASRPASPPSPITAPYVPTVAAPTARMAQPRPAGAPAPVAPPPVSSPTPTPRPSPAQPPRHCSNGRQRHAQGSRGCHHPRHRHHRNHRRYQ